MDSWRRLLVVAELNEESYFAEDIIEDEVI